MQAIKVRQLLLNLSFIMCLTSCTPAIPTASPSQSQTLPTPTPKLATALIIDVKGQVEITRSEWRPDVHALISAGAEYHPDDLLFVRKDAQATILCPDLTLKMQTSGTYGLHEICPDSTLTIWKNNGELSGPPRGKDIYTPYILSPRATKLLSDKPLLKWTLAAGATTYTVQVMADTMVFSTMTPLTETQYAGQPLVPGKSYLLTVIPDANSSKIEQDPTRVFSLLSHESADRVNAATKEAKLLGLTKTSELLVNTYIYKSAELYAEAIDQIAPYSAGDGRLALQLGGLYIQTGLPSMAEEVCKIATAAAEAAQDQEMRAQALVCLGQAQLSTGEDQATVSLNAAREIYTSTLGAQQDVERIDKLLKLLP